MTELSELEQLEQDPRSRGDLAAARLASLVTGLLEQVDEASALKNKDIATAMGVTPGRVSQLLCGDGNLRVGTLARLLDAFGYDLALTAHPKGGQGEAITVPRPGRRRPQDEVTPPSAKPPHKCIDWGSVVMMVDEADEFVGRIDLAIGQNVLVLNHLDRESSDEVVVHRSSGVWLANVESATSARPAKRKMTWGPRG